VVFTPPNFINHFDGSRLDYAREQTRLTGTVAASESGSQRATSGLGLNLRLN